MVEIGENIKKLRKAKRMTQKEVANQLNVTPQTISKWERNISYPDLDMLVKLSQLFHISTDALLGNTKPTFFCFLILKKEKRENDGKSTSNSVHYPNRQAVLI